MSKKAKLPNILSTLRKSLNPLEYTELKDRKLIEGFKFFCIIILFGTLITTIAFAVPTQFKFISTTQKIIDSIEDARLVPYLELREPVLINRDVDDNSIIADIIIDDQNKYSANQSNIYIGQDYVYFNKAKQKKSINEILNLSLYKEKISKALPIISALLIPSIFVGLYLLYFSIYIIIICAISIVLYMIFAKKNISFRSLISVGFHAAIVLVLASVIQAIKGNFQLFPFGLVVLVFFTLYYIAGVVISKQGKKGKKETEIELESR